MILYHGTTKHFDQFEQKPGWVTHTFSDPEQVYRTGFFFTASLNFAKWFAGDGGDVIVADVKLGKTLKFPSDKDIYAAYGVLYSHIGNLVDALEQEGIPFDKFLNFVYSAEPRWAYLDGENGIKFAKAVQKAGYSSLSFYEEFECRSVKTYVVFDPDRIHVVDRQLAGKAKHYGRYENK